MKVVTLSKKNKILKGEINLPASKSISNRALIINHLTQNQLRLHNLSPADDTQLMIELLQKISEAKFINSPIELNCENAGTAMRFLTALLANKPGDWILTGSERMKDRPIGILVEALNQMGAEINYLEKDGFPPLEIKGKILKGGQLKIDGGISSQFISALLLIAPVLENGLHLILSNKISSKPYVEMTLGMLNYFGVTSIFEGNEIYIQHQNFKLQEMDVEPDWSAAAYCYEMAALADEADIILKDLILTKSLKPTNKSGITQNLQSLQGDSILPEIYKSFAVDTEIVDQGIRLTKKGNAVSKFDFDFTNYPDLAQPVIVTCAALGIKGSFTGLESLRIKETDRLQALQTELQNLGFKTGIVRSSEFEVRSYRSGTIKNHQSKIINTFGDHRMAMAFAPLALIYDNIQIENPSVVSKSYPNFWKDLKSVGIDTFFWPIR